MIDRAKLFFNEKKSHQAYLALADQAMVSGANFITGVLLARYLGLQNYGVFAIAWIAALFFSSIQQALIIAPLQTLGEKKEGREKQEFYTALFIIQFLFCVLAVLFTYEFCLLSNIFFYQTELRFLKFILPLAVFTFLMNEYFRKIFFVKGKNITALILDAISYSIQIVGLVLLAYFEQLNLPRAMIVIAFSNSISSTYGVIKLENIGFNARKIESVFWECWNYSKWLIGTSILQWVSGNFFIVSAGGILGAAAVGAIRMAQNIIGILHILFLALENFIPTTAARIYNKKGLKALYNYLKRMTILGGAATFFALVCLCVFAQQIIAVLYGKDFIGTEKVLFGFAILYVFVFIGMPLRFAIRTVEKNKDIFVSYIISAAFSLILAAPMISYLGIYGVFAGLIMSQVILQLWYIYALKSEIKLVWK
ncbi:MAG: putative export protein [Bacteroidota bacterium]|jgi:O-antigen/teichoic acid export membrane protein